MIIIIILLWIISIIGGYLYIRPKLKTTQQIDQTLANTNIELAKQNQELQTEYKALQVGIEENQKTAQFWTDYLTKSQEDALHLSDSYKKTCIERAQKDADIEIEKIRQQYLDEIESYKADYLNLLAETADNFQKEINQKIKEQNKLDDEIKERENEIQAYVELNKRLYEEEHKNDYYRLCLSDNDLTEIHELRKITPTLKNSEPLMKAIWKIYYEKPYTDLVGRVVGNGRHTGIYKITNIENKMCYVGQAVDIADRWKTHIKRGIGAEAPGNNKLYPAMLSFGVENFTFEILEECDRSKLNEREDYWQDVCKAKEFGYSIK